MTHQHTQPAPVQGAKETQVMRMCTDTHVSADQEARGHADEHHLEAAERASRQGKEGQGDLRPGAAAADTMP
jgi:hypothetical protein